MDVIVTYESPARETGGWNHLTVPSRGSVVLYPDGLLNILDASGRTHDVKHNVKRFEFFPGYMQWLNELEDKGLSSFDAEKPTP